MGDNMTDLLERVTRSIAQYHGWFGGWRKFLPDGRAALAAMTPEDHAAVLRDAGWSVFAPNMSGRQPMPADNSITAARLAAALEALTERAFKRCLFPDEVREAFSALDQFKEETSDAQS